MSSAESPKKRRARAPAAEAEEATTTKKTVRRRAAAKDEAPAAEVPAAAAPAAEEAPKKRGRAKKADAAVEAEPARAAPHPEPRPEPAPEPRPETRPEPKPEPRPEPKPEPVRAEAPAAQASHDAAPQPAPAAPPQPQAQGGQQQGQQQQGQRHQHRNERHRNRHERHGQQQQGQQQQGQPQGGHQQHGHQQQQGQQQQGQQPGQGQGRRRRRRGRGGGGGQAQLSNGQPNPAYEAQLQPAFGILEIDERGQGRLRRTDKNFLAGENDAEVPKQIIERFRLRPGAFVNASTLLRNGKPQVQRVDQVEGVSPDEASNRLSFMNLTSVDPDRRIQLETVSSELLTRAIDVISPIGFGQRGLIVAPPKTGKTIILQKIAKAILTNHPKTKLMVLLIDERPEEVTDFKRSIGADVYASSSDRPAHEHLRIAELVMERARRLVEAGDDVVVLLDSITRLARAYNKEIESSGRTMSGGVDSRALERPKRIFGAARNTEEAGSLTIIATALIDTGSRMDEVIFEEFKGTGNMEIVLDRQLAERRLFPAINVNNSGTRKEEKLFSQKENEKIRKLRAYLSALRPVEAMEKLLGRLRDFRSNAEFFDAI